MGPRGNTPSGVQLAEPLVATHLQGLGQRPKTTMKNDCVQKLTSLFHLKMITCIVRSWSNLLGLTPTKSDTDSSDWGCISLNLSSCNRISQILRTVFSTYLTVCNCKIYGNYICIMTDIILLLRNILEFALCSQIKCTYLVFISKWILWTQTTIRVEISLLKSNNIYTSQRDLSVLKSFTLFINQIPNKIFHTDRYSWSDTTNLSYREAKVHRDKF